MHVPFLDLRPALTPELRVAIAQAFDRVMTSGVFLNGPEVAAFEQEWATYCGQKYCVACASGTDAISIGLMGSIYTNDGAILIPANSCEFTWTGAIKAYSTATELFGHLSHVPPILFDDIDDNGWWTHKNAIPVLLHGRVPSSGQALGLIDACQAHGWRPAGIDGTVCWSFYPTKNLGAFADAGAITTDNGNAADTIRQCARLWHSRMSEIDAAILRAKLPYLDQWNVYRLGIAARYYSELDGLPFRFSTPIGSESNYHIFGIQTEHRDGLRHYLKTVGVETGSHYPKPLADLPGANKWCGETLSLPCYPGMPEQHIEYVIDIIRAFFIGEL